MPQPMDSAALRACMGRFATGVCIVSAWDGRGAACGMTVNSFTSLSLDPPLILWNIQRSSSCHPLLAAAPWFAVNMLRLEQRPLAERCALRSGHLLHPNELCDDEAAEAPLLRDTLASLVCSHWRRYDGGDHEIIVGRVARMARAAGGAPLLYYDSDYGSMADA